MSEAGLRLLDRDLPRISVWAPAFMRRVHRQRRIDEVAAYEATHAFPPKPRKTAALRRERAELARLSAVIDADTRRLLVDPNDAGKMASAIIFETARRHGVSVEDIRGSCRAQFLVAVRHQAIARVYLAHPEMSLPHIARVTGGRDHTTVLHALRKAGIYQPRRSLDRRQEQR